MSYTYRMMAQDLDDAFRASGKGYSYTFRGFMDVLRIDYVLYSEDLECLRLPGFVRCGFVGSLSGRGPVEAGQKIVVVMILDSLRNWALYCGADSRLKRALEYLAATDLNTLEPGRYEIEGAEIFLKVTEGGPQTGRGGFAGGAR